MNAIVPAEPIATGLVPATMGEAMKLAEMMASAKLVPQALQKSPADCLMVILQAVRWQMDPFAVAQECSVIQGKAMPSGKLVAAVVNARGNLANRLAYDYDGDGDERTITVTGRLQNEAESRSITVKLKDARTSNKVWQTQPDQQLMYHGVRVWARRHTPELMLGVYSPEEFDDPTAMPAKKPPRPAPLELARPKDEPHDPDTGEILPSPPAPHEAVEAAAPSQAAVPAGGAADDDFFVLDEIRKALQEAAANGMDALADEWGSIHPRYQHALVAEKAKWKMIATAADQQQARKP